MSNEDIENKAELLVTQHTEKELIKLVVAIDNEIGDLNFTQLLLGYLIDSLGMDLQRDEVESILTNILNDE